jgi:hypothetical protein
LGQPNDDKWLYFHVACSTQRTGVATAFEIDLESVLRRTRGSEHCQDEVGGVAVLFILKLCSERQGTAPHRAGWGGQATAYGFISMSHVQSKGPAFQPLSEIDLGNFLRRIHGSKPTQHSCDVVCFSLHLVSFPSCGRSAKRLSTTSRGCGQASDDKWVQVLVTCPIERIRVAAPNRK